jgi:hypothetical protein
MILVPEEFSAPVALLVAGFVGLLVFVFFEVSLLGMITIMATVILTLTHALLVFLILRIVLIMVMLLEKWSGHGRYYASSGAETHKRGQCQKNGFQVQFQNFILGAKQSSKRPSGFIRESRKVTKRFDRTEAKARRNKGRPTSGLSLSSSFKELAGNDQWKSL